MKTIGQNIWLCHQFFKMCRSRFKTFSGVSSPGQINILLSRRFALCLLFAISLVFSSGCRFFRTSIADTIELEQIIDESGITGGLIVYAGSGDIIFPSAWGEGSGFLVHRLVNDQDRLLSVRESIHDKGLYGKVSAVEWDGSFLPYSDNMVNLLILSDESAGLSTRKFRKEIDRVLVPEGLAYVSRRGGKFSRYQKTWPEDMDHWTHARYDASGNASSNDRQVGAPQHVQWYASPKWNRSTKTSSMVSAGGRVFYILDDAHFFASKETWSLIARDAFNGILLWRREMPAWRANIPADREMGSLSERLIRVMDYKKTGPVQTDRLLVATEDRIYTVLSEFAPASILDAKTGEILQTLSHTEFAEEIILTDNVLLVLANPNTPADIRRGLSEAKTIFAHNAETGEILWQHPVELIMPTTLAADHRQVIWHNGECIVSLDLRTGEQRWKSVSTGHRVEGLDYTNRPGFEDLPTILLTPSLSPTLIIYEDYIAFAGGRQLSVFSSEDGSELWKRDYLLSNYSVPVEIFGFGGLLWGPDVNRGSPMSINFNSYDPYTGEIIDTIRTDAGFSFAHHRCHQMKTTAGRIICAMAGIELIDAHTGSIQSHHWARGSCHYGVMPANGMLYVPPHDCACFVRSKLSGFYALRADRSESSFKKEVSQRLYHGPAYGGMASEQFSDHGEDWPTYRHDASRSGHTLTSISPMTEYSWGHHLGGNLTAPVVSGGRVFVASTDAHKLYALDAHNGEIIWDYNTGGRIDSPPTIYKGLVLFGSRDGWVYALRAGDGVLVWRFMACPEDLWIVSDGQLESVWPVHGSVLVVNDVVYFSAGRSSYLDGGIHLYGLDPLSGEQILHRVLNSLGPDGSQITDSKGVDGYLNDILSSDGSFIFMRHQVFDLSGNPQDTLIAHLHGPDGFLSYETTFRLDWTYAPLYTSTSQGAFYDHTFNRYFYPSGRILVKDDAYVYGFGQYYFDNMRPGRLVKTDGGSLYPAIRGGEWALFGSPKDRTDIPAEISTRELQAHALKNTLEPVKFRWKREIPVWVQGMLQADDILFVAGPPARPDITIGISQEAVEGSAESELLSVSTSDGLTLSRKLLPGTPVWDGMAVTETGLFISMRDGSVLCLKPEE